MKKIYSFLTLVALAMPACAAELFPGGMPDANAKGATLQSGSTMGGYPIYPGDGSWLVAEMRNWQADGVGEAQAVSIGTVQLVQREPNGQWAVSLWTTTNLNNVGVNQYMMGSPCSGNHLLVSNKFHGKDDNCLTVDAQMETLGARQVLVLVVRVTQTRSAGRIYNMQLLLNSETLGLQGLEPAQLSALALQAAPERRAFMERFQKWAQGLQDAAARAIDVSKPQDAFAQVPSYKALVSATGAI